ncbi:hypothetical protein OHC33_007547 [Knufia fluminis]|uniref:ADP-ribosylhydrolase ARH3 n=1 Tax=Knufia fluminis TaxID=191047 RepID=A0AAN8F526_9EURO|nr:hypothetical protein OHC33_007547 [Knufia fluminis]
MSVDTMKNNEPFLNTRIRTALYGLAVCDALGAPLEFQPRQHDRPKYVRDMLPNANFDLPAGHFTDDTSMALCLAHSLVTSNGKHNAFDQAIRYVRWLDEGYMSSVADSAFDVGTQTRQALQYWRQSASAETLNFVGRKFDEDWRCGNGSLMRVLPCALVAKTEQEAVVLAKESSRVTHPHTRCVDACGLYTRLAWHALQGANKEQLIGEMQKHVESLEVELRKRLQQYDSIEAFDSKPRKQISSSGYVIDSLEAALWALFTTETFEAGAIEVVNLGDDADTVGAIYGGLAGAFYGKVECIPERWLRDMKSFELVVEAAQHLIDLHTRV